MRSAPADSVQYLVNAGIGIGTSYQVAPAPTPFSQVFDGTVQTLRVPEHSAAQNMYPSMPGDVAPLAFVATLRTKLPVELCSDVVKLLHSGITLLPTRYTAP